MLRKFRYDDDCFEGWKVCWRFIWSQSDLSSKVVIASVFFWKASKAVRGFRNNFQHGRLYWVSVAILFWPKWICWFQVVPAESFLGRVIQKWHILLSKLSKEISIAANFAAKAIIRNIPATYLMLRCWYFLFLSVVIFFRYCYHL